MKEQLGDINNIANSDFEAAFQKGFRHSILNWLFNQNNSLMDFDEIRKEIPWQGQFDIGMKEIRMEDIVGSVGRYQDFDRSFLPRRIDSRDRWVNIDKAHIKEINLPPIEVYKVGSVYFVKDGNHRVSVARERGQQYIEANVIEIKTAIPITADTDIDDLIRKREEIEFLEQSRIKKLRPDAQIEFSLPGGYSKLLEHIKAHRWFLGERRNRAISWDEAVTHWYDKVYLPLIIVIRRNNILKEFPHRTEADLYLWISEHLWYLRQKNQQEVSVEEAALHFAENYSQNLGRRLQHFFEKLLRIFKKD
ncbi:MAG: hypothetical protein LWX83_06165 [Anaerolineae bacterium]|nr:hypothetical protein [Anaerolineae bacterium]